MNILQTVTEVIIETTGGENIVAEQKLKEDIGLDSLSLVAVIVGLEERFEIEFKESDLDPSKLLTVSDLVSLVEKYV